MDGLSTPAMSQIVGFRVPKPAVAAVSVSDIANPFRVRRTTIAWTTRATAGWREDSAAKNFRPPQRRSPGRPSLSESRARKAGGLWLEQTEPQKDGCGLELAIMRSYFAVSI